MGLTHVNTSSHLGQSYHVGRNKDNNNSKSRPATYVAFDIYIYIYIMISVDYIQCIKYSIFNISIEFQDIKFRRQKSSFRDNVLGRKLVGKNGFIVNSISTDSVL